MTSPFAYLDVSSGSQIMTVIAGGFAALVVTLKLYWNRFLKLLRIRKPDEQQAGESPAKQADTT
jgi:hypothetical protein